MDKKICFHIIKEENVCDIAKTKNIIYTFEGREDAICELRKMRKRLVRVHYGYDTIWEAQEKYEYLRSTTSNTAFVWENKVNWKRHIINCYIEEWEFVLSDTNDDTTS